MTLKTGNPSPTKFTVVIPMKTQNVNQNGKFKICYQTCTSIFTQRNNTSVLIIGVPEIIQSLQENIC